MSHTLELLTTVEHGTVAGYRAGCHGSANACGAVVSCIDVFTRYQGDWGFRKRVDAGEAPIDILVQELAEAEAVRARDKAANRRAKADASKTNDARLAKQKRMSTPQKERAPKVVDRIVDDVARLVAEGKSVRETAELLGVSVVSVTKARQARGIPARKSVDRTEIARLNGEGLTDTEIAARLGVSNSTISYVRRNVLHLPRISTSHLSKAQESARARRARLITDLHALGKTDGEIAEALDMTRTAVYQARGRLGLALNRQTTRKPRTAPDASGHADPHDEPREAREAVIEAHGTPQGYTDGCRGRGCPATPSCTDAALEQHRAARHAAGGAR